MFDSRITDALPIFFTKVFANTNNALIFVLPNGINREGKI